MLDPSQPELTTVPSPVERVHRRVLATAALIGGATIVAKLVAFAKEWMVARQFGASDEVDAYWMALVIPSFAVGVVSNAFTASFLPSYLRVSRHEGAQAAERLLAAALARGVALLAATTIGLAAVAPWLLPVLAAGFDAPKLALTASLFYVMVGLLAACGLGSLFAAVLNAHERFVATALAPMAPPVTMVSVFFLFRERYGIYALAAGTLLGFVLECLILAAAVWRRGLFAWPHWSRPHPAMSHVAREATHGAAGGALTCGSTIVDQSMAASLAAGNVAILNYGNKIVALVLSIVAVSLSTVLFPRFSRLRSDGNWSEIKRTLHVYLAIVFAASIPGLALLAWWGEPLVRLLFERGAFTGETTAAVSRVQLFTIPQIPFYVLALLGGRLLAALDANASVLRIAALNLVLNVVGNLVFMYWFGVAGIALSTSLVYVVASLVTYAAIRRRLRTLGGA